MSEKKVTGIRGLDLKVYEQIQELSRKRNENVANIINEALKNYLSESEDVEYEAPQIISGQNRFELTAEALEQLSPLRIEDIDTLLVLDDFNKISEDMIEKNLDRIVRVREIHCPKRLYYLFLKKTKNVGQISYYEGKWREEKILRFFSSTKLNSNILERFKKENYKLKIIVSSGDLFLSPDITLDLFEDVVSEIVVKGNLAVSDELYASLLTIGTIEGIVQLINKEGKPIDQIQYEKNFFTSNEESGSKKKGKSKTPQFSFSFTPGLENLFESIEEIKEGVKNALQNLDLDKELNLSGLDADKSQNERKSRKKKRDRIRPSKDDN